MFAYLCQNELAQVDGNVRGFALEARHDGSGIESSVAHEYRTLPVTAARPASAIAVIDAVVIGAAGLTPYQGPFIALEVVTQLKLDIRPGKVLPDE